MAKARRGPYSKGIARRAEILRVALEAYQASGRQGPSLKCIADHAGLTEAGVLHYFGSKDELLVEVLVARDREYAEKYDLTTAEGTWALLAHTAQTPGLVKLFVDMTAAAADPAHPAHAFMQRRTSAILDLIARRYGPGKEWEARVLLAAAEGLQIRWLRDPSTDVIGDLQRLTVALGLETGSPEPL
ncbi:TetR/AcrR family transcriptional regulator [Actinomadura rupiterrae]|uniref:TetR/AcrR family transcriptional regulator n=1 Tax=Actinomadura rupiterrae TaxID=559627 RepID=UPI0020A536A1|nr:helix-turn-helix domain-containing protein [Actinomadura rupiterrae]MCP2342436.1 AcrR family transcriptional regulator [Actinomadura rupiterrae]